MYINNKIINGSKFLLAVLSVLIIASCEEDDVFTGEPQGPVTVLMGSITTPETQVAGSQSFPVTISLGDNPDTPEVDLLTFPMDVSVEAITIITNSNKRTRKAFVIPAGQNSLVSTMNAPSAETSFMPFNLSVQMYLSAITSVPEAEELRGFAGKQYTITSDIVTLGYGDTPIPAINGKKLGIRFDWPGALGTAGNVNNLFLVLKKNGSVMPSLSTAQGIAVSATRPIYGAVAQNGQYESVNFYDVKQELKISNQTLNDSINHIYTIKSIGSTVATNDKPHNFKVGDQVQLENVNGVGSAPLVVQVATVADPYTFTFNYNGPNLFGTNNSYYQPKFVPRKITYVPQAWIAGSAYVANTPITYNSVNYYALVNIVAGTNPSNQLPSTLNSAFWTTVQPNETWSPFLAYFGNESVIVNSVTYYAIRNIAVNPAGNLIPSLDPANWTSVKPVIDWDVALLNPPAWVPGSGTYLVNQVYKYNNVVYVCIKQHTLTSATPTPNNDPTRWTTAAVEYPVDVLNYTSTDTYTVEVYAKALITSPVDLPYRFSIRFPNETSKIFTGTFTNLTVGTAANAVPKLQIVKTTTQGASTYEVTQL